MAIYGGGAKLVPHLSFSTPQICVDPLFHTLTGTGESDDMGLETISELWKLADDQERWLLASSLGFWGRGAGADTTASVLCL
jgi:hypothetical protein